MTLSIGGMDLLNANEKIRLNNVPFLSVKRGLSRMREDNYIGRNMNKV